MHILYWFLVVGNKFVILFLFLFKQQTFNLYWYVSKNESILCSYEEDDESEERLISFVV